MITEKYTAYLSEEKKLSDNTCMAYMRDACDFENFLKTRGVKEFRDAASTDVVAYLMSLKAEGMSQSTVNRRLASVRILYDFLEREHETVNNPTENIKSPRIEKKDIEFLSIDEIDRIMALPDKSPKGVRDRAILEMMYATGIRASELIDMKISYVNLRMGFVKCEGDHAKTRIIPLGRLARKAVEDYLFEVRDSFVKGRECDILFVNYKGDPLTRQGLWKVLKEYGEKAELSIKLTPQVIRNSFAVHMLQNGADVKSIQELMGHEDIMAAQAYLAVTKNRIKDVYDRTHPRA